MAKAKPVLHIQLENSGGRQIGADEEVTLSDKEINWLAGFFAPMVKESLRKEISTV